MKKWGLVLSGGIAWGLANEGVLEVLEEEGLRPDYLAGNSMGAIVGVLYALGFPASVRRSLADGLKLHNVTRVRRRSTGGVPGIGFLRQNMAKHLRHLLGDARIGDCRIPFLCVAGRMRAPIPWRRVLREGFAKEWRANIETHVFPPDTRILNALMATSAVPLVFEPVRVKGETFVDLGNFGNIPARELREAYGPAVVISTDTAPRYSKVRRFCPASLRTFIDEGRKARERSRSLCDLVIEPAPAAGPLRFDKGMAFIEAGREAARGAVGEVKELVG